MRAYDAVKTVVVYEDPTFDAFPLYALHLDRTPGDGGQEPHTGRLIDDQAVHHLDFEADDPKVTKVALDPAALSEVPVKATILGYGGSTGTVTERYAL